MRELIRGVYECFVIEHVDQVGPTGFFVMKHHEARSDFEFEEIEDELAVGHRAIFDVVFLLVLVHYEDGKVHTDHHHSFTRWPVVT